MRKFENQKHHSLLKCNSSSPLLSPSSSTWLLTTTLTKKLYRENIQLNIHITKCCIASCTELSSLTQKRRLQLAGHVIRGNLKTSTQDSKSQEQHTRLDKGEVVRLAHNKVRWKDMVVSSLPSGWYMYVMYVLIKALLSKNSSYKKKVRYLGKFCRGKVICSRDK